MAFVKHQAAMLDEQSQNHRDQSLIMKEQSVMLEEQSKTSNEQVAINARQSATIEEQVRLIKVSDKIATNI